MRTLTLSLFALALVLAVPSAAAPADDAAPAVSEVPLESAPPAAGDATPAPYTPADAGKIELGDVGAFGSCSATADCAGGGSVSCSAQSGSCWFVDNCYAVCNNQYYWCGYRPYPCPV